MVFFQKICPINEVNKIIEENSVWIYYVRCHVNNVMRATVWVVSFPSHSRPLFHGLWRVKCPLEVNFRIMEKVVGHLDIFFAYCFFAFFSFHIGLLVFTYYIVGGYVYSDTGWLRAKIYPKILCWVFMHFWSSETKMYFSPHPMRKKCENYIDDGRKQIFWRICGISNKLMFSLIKYFKNHGMPGQFVPLYAF